MTMCERKYLSPQEVADMWGITRATVLNRITSGELPAVRIGSNRLRVAVVDAEGLGRPVRGARAS